MQVYFSWVWRNETADNERLLVCDFGKVILYFGVKLILDSFFSRRIHYHGSNKEK